MQDDKGKVILSLIAGATAGIVAGLLLAPETGDDTRAHLHQSASKWGHDLSKLAKEALAKARSVASPATLDAATTEAKEAADRLLQRLDGPAEATPEA